MQQSQIWSGRDAPLIDRARVQPIPNVTFQGLFNWQDNRIGGKPDGGVALSVPLPIFDKNQGAIMRAEPEAAAARYAVTQVELDLQNRLAPVFEAYANARNQVSRYRDTILPAAEESLTLTRQMYQAGETNYLGLLTAQRTFAQTNRNYLDAVLQLQTADAEMDGLLLSGKSAISFGNGIHANEHFAISCNHCPAPLDAKSIKSRQLVVKFD